MCLSLVFKHSPSPPHNLWAMPCAQTLCAVLNPLALAPDVLQDLRLQAAELWLELLKLLGNSAIRHRVITVSNQLSKKLPVRKDAAFKHSKHRQKLISNT